MIIRKASLEDVKTLNWLLTLLIRDEKKYDNNINENFTVTNMYENYIYDENKIILVAIEEGKIAGYIYGYIIEPDAILNNKIAKLDALYILEEYRNKGIASNLINEFKNNISKQNVNNIEVNVCSQNKVAKQLYQKHGFVTNKETLNLKIN